MKRATRRNTKTLRKKNARKANRITRKGGNIISRIFGKSRIFGNKQVVPVDNLDTNDLLKLLQNYEKFNLDKTAVEEKAIELIEQNKYTFFDINRGRFFRENYRNDYKFYMLDTLELAIQNNMDIVVLHFLLNEQKNGINIPVEIEKISKVKKFYININNENIPYSYIYDKIIEIIGKKDIIDTLKIYLSNYYAENKNKKIFENGLSRLIEYFTRQLNFYTNKEKEYTEKNKKKDYTERINFSIKRKEDYNEKIEKIKTFLNKTEIEKGLSDTVIDILLLEFNDEIYSYKERHNLPELLKYYHVAPVNPDIQKSVISEKKNSQLVNNTFNPIHTTRQLDNKTLGRQ